MRVLILMPGTYPCGGADVSRMQKFARGLMACGDDVAIIATQRSGAGDRQWQRDDHGVSYARVPISRGGSKLGRVLGRQLLPRRMLAKFRQVVAAETVDAVILYGPHLRLFRRIIGLCRRRGIAVAVECNEWYLRPFNLSLAPDFVDQAVFRRWMFPRCGGIIGISRLWEEHAAARGLRCLRVPALGEQEPSPVTQAAGGRFRLTYMGLLAPRDMPQTLLEGVRRAVARGADVELVVIGNVDAVPTGRQARRQVAADPVLRDRVIFTGYVTSEQVRQHLRDAGALVLLRTQNREVRACFPTRLPEYLQTGRPVILSAVGDIPLYFEHGRDAWLLTEGDRPDELAEALVRLSADAAEARRIGLAGQQTCIRQFGYLPHGRRIHDFLEQLRAAARRATA
jgi:glycosyltransferase involved in cell wall biosynthesis